MADNELSTEKQEGAGISRRSFVAGVGGAGVGLALGGFAVKALYAPDEVYAVPASEGYLLVDTKKCAGCSSCMMACSMVHTGKSDLSLSRIQVVNNVFEPYPGGIAQEQCRQCTAPLCAFACPTGAMHADADNGNVRTVDQAKCIGCERCIQACPFTPSRVQWDPNKRRAQKCDLCADTPFMTEDGGPGGQQACAAVCGIGAITFSKEIPVQSDKGYRVNLRNTPSYALVGLPQGDNGEYTVQPAAAAGGH